MQGDYQDNGMTAYADDDEDSPSRQLAGIVAPRSAQSLVGMVGPPPDTAPAHEVGRSTPLTGNLAAAPSQALPKNKDTGTGYDSGTAAPPDNGNVRTISPVQPMQQLQPANTGGLQPAVMNPDPTGSLRPGGSGSGPMPVLPAGTTQVNAPSQIDRDQAARDALVNRGSPIHNIQRPWLRALAGVGDVALGAVAPGIAPFVKGSTPNYQRNLGIANANLQTDQDQAKNQANIADITSQTGEREALGRKADALAAADAPQPLSKARAALLGHPELEGEPMTQRALATLGTATISGNSRVATGAGHDATKVTTTGMNNATSTANTATRASSNETIAQARDKTQRLLGELRASVSTANNERTNQTHLTTSGMRAAGGTTAGQPGNYKVPADVTKRAALAANVQENAGEVAKLVDANQEILGSIGGRFTNAEQMIGNDNPAISALGTRIHNIALAANGAHGVRSQEAVHATEREILNNFHNGPNAIKGALNATTTSVQTFLDDEKNFRQTGGRVAPAAPPASGPARDPNMLYARDPSGKLHAAPKEGAKPLPSGWKYDTGGK